MKDQLLRPESPAAREMTTKHDPRPPAPRDPARASLPGVGHAPRNTRSGEPEPRRHARRALLGVRRRRERRRLRRGRGDRRRGGLAERLPQRAAPRAPRSTCRRAPAPSRAPPSRARGTRVAPVARHPPRPRPPPRPSRAPRRAPRSPTPARSSARSCSRPSSSPGRSSRRRSSATSASAARCRSSRAGQGRERQVLAGLVPPRRRRLRLRARYATLDIKSPQVRLGITPPNLDDVLPYKYAYNTAHGTPLYRSVPSTRGDAQVRAVPRGGEEGEAQGRRRDGRRTTSRRDAGATTPPTAEKARQGRGGREGRRRSGSSTRDAGAPPSERRSRGGSSRTRRASRSTSSSTTSRRTRTATLAKRMVKGFFVAIDKTVRVEQPRLVQDDRRPRRARPTACTSSSRRPPQGIDVPEGVKQVGFITAPKAGEVRVRRRARRRVKRRRRRRRASRPSASPARPSTYKAHRLPADDRGLVDEGHRRHHHRARPAARPISRRARSGST